MKMIIGVKLLILIISQLAAILIENWGSISVTAIFFDIVTSDSGSTIFLDIVDNCEQCGHHNIVQPFNIARS